MTTQIELEQYIELLFSYIDGTEYDWSVEFYEGEEISARNTTKICSFGDGRFEVLQMPQFGGIKERDGTYTYELDNGYRCHAYYCYTLHDRQTDQRMQYTLFDYTQEGDWLYTYGNAGYLKLQVNTGETAVYEAFEDIPTQEQPLFDRVDDAEPIREVTLLAPYGMRHEGCEITEDGCIGEERIVRKIALTDITLERCDGSCQP